MTNVEVKILECTTEFGDEERSEGVLSPNENLEDPMDIPKSNM